MATESGVSGQQPSKPSDSAVRAQLDSILASAVFSRSPHLRRFLAYIVEQSLAGHGPTLKESVLAHELYGKGTDFDAGNDPVVRVDARRLRDKLREFNEGRSDPVLISLPKGSYMPVFESREASPAPATRPAARSRISLWALALVVVLVTTAAAWYAARRAANVPAQLRPLASYPGIEGPPALSPDGDLVAFAWSGVDSGPTDIYVKAVDSEALRRLTETADAESSPAWSPDGQTIAFVRNAQGVFTISQLGGVERQVSAAGTHVAWAGDSKSVLIRDREGNAGPFGIYRVALDTLERSRLTQATVGAGDWKFEVSPNGKTLAFIRYERPGIADLFVLPMRGGEPRRLSNWHATLTGLAWTPDGEEIVYSVEEPAVGRLWRIAANSAHPDRGAPVADIPAPAESPSISRPAPGHPARLAFQTVARDVDLRLVQLATNAADRTLDSQAFGSSTRVEASASFSPDDSRIAFASSRSGSLEIWVAARNDSAMRQVTALGAPELVVGGWSPDATRIAFDAAVAGNSDIYVVGADGGHLQRLTSEPSLDALASWSRDGRGIYFTSTRAGAKPDIWRVPATGGAAVRITHDGGFEPQESADGRFIYYLDRHPAGLRSDGTAALMRAPLNGGKAEQVLERVRPFLWSVTDAGIVYLSRETQFDVIEVYRFSDRQVIRLGQLGFRVPEIFSHLTASRDGRWLLATQMVRFDADLMRLDNFR
jgi:Tol biopolymer transport system component